MDSTRSGLTSWEHVPIAVVDRVEGLGLMAVLGVAVLGVAAGGPEWLIARHVTTAVLLLAGALILSQYLRSDWTISDFDLVPYRFSFQLLLYLVLLGVLYQSWSPGYGLAFDRAGQSTIVFLALIAFCVVARDPREYSFLQWLVIGCLATVVGIFFYHGLSIAESSGQARQPFWWGAIMAIGLVVIPQYLSRAQFLWAIDRFTAGLVVLAMPVYVIGEYSLFGLSFTFHGAFTIPILDVEMQATRSLFVNRNAFAMMVFAGFIAAIAEFHHAFTRQRPAWTIVVPGVLLAMNGLGLALSYGRALWVITPMATGIYLVYVLFDRRAVPIAVVAGFVYLVGGIAVVQSGILPLPEGTPTRENRWMAAVAAIRDQPSLLGAGLVDPGAYIAPYQRGTEWSPHNSYLTMAIRAGLIGGTAYAVLIATSLLAGLLEIRETDVGASVAVLSLAVGFTAHQMFEAYTLFNWSSGSVIAILVFGFLVFGDAWRITQSSSPD